MAAARLGYVIAPTWVVQAIESVVLPYHLDAAKQAAGRLALRFVDDMHERVKQLVSERERLQAAMGRLPLQQWESGANFVLFRPTAMDGNDVWQALLEHSVLVRNCASWPRLDGCLRVTVGTPGENDAFLRALTEILSA
jgi:histidinol-phosphate aminotransferase